MRRGEVWVADLSNEKGAPAAQSDRLDSGVRRNDVEGSRRPVVVMQVDELLDAGMPMVVVLPLTTQLFAGSSRWRVTVPARDRLLRDSQVIVDQPRTLDRARLGEGPLTRLKDNEMATVEQGLKIILGIL